LFTTKTQAYELTFDDSLLTSFGDIDETYTDIIFDRGISDFAGIFFWLESDSLSSSENLDIEGESDSLDCNERVRGLYFNTQRGGSLRPLDQESLDILAAENSGYSNITLEWGRYRDCDWEDDKNIYWQINHVKSGIIYKMVAGMQISGNSYNQIFDETLVFDDDQGVALGEFFDSRGWVWLSYLAWGETNPDKFSFPLSKTDELEEFILSEEVEIDGLGDSVSVLATIAEVDGWVLYINGDEVGQTWMVQNWDQVQIELLSSDEYDVVVSSTLHIGNRSSTFYVLTQDWEFYDGELTIWQKLKIFTIFKLTISPYVWDEERMEEFLYTFKSMLEDRIDQMDDNDEERATLQYLLDITESYLMDGIDYDQDDNNEYYIAPNCKKYRLDYNSERQAYYSPDFIIIHYFISRDSIRKYIDDKNQGDSLCQDANQESGQDRRVAPNGKVYSISRVAQGYTSIDFIYTRTFDSLEALRKYIDYNNPAITVRDHNIDKDFDAEEYEAPNWKIYIIQNSDEWYFSYKFVRPMYFDELRELKDYIDQKNPE